MLAIVRDLPLTALRVRRAIGARDDRQAPRRLRLSGESTASRDTFGDPASRCALVVQLLGQAALSLPQCCT